MLKFLFGPRFLVIRSVWAKLFSLRYRHERHTPRTSSTTLVLWYRQPTDHAFPQHSQSLFSSIIFVSPLMIFDILQKIMQSPCQDVLPIYVQGIGNLRGRDGRGLCQLNICGLPIYWQRIDNIPCGMRDTPYKGEKVSEARRPLTDAGSGYCGIPDTICGAPHTVPCYVFSGVANICRGYIGKPLVVPQTHPRTLKRYLKPEGP